MPEWKTRRSRCAVCGDRLSDANRSKPYPARCKPCIAAYFADRRRPVGMDPRRIRSSNAWKQLSIQVRAAGRCADCGAILDPSQLEAGHGIPAAHRPDLALAPWNVRPLCAACNQRGPKQ